MRSRAALVAPFVAFLVLVSVFLRQEQSDGGSGVYDFARRVGNFSNLVCQTSETPVANIEEVHLRVPRNPYFDYTNFTCDPYLEPGYVTIDTGNFSNNYWTSYNPACPRAPDYVHDMIAGKSMPWLEGKTILLIGDSVDRLNARYFCDALNGVDVGWFHYHYGKDSHLYVENVTFVGEDGETYPLHPQLEVGTCNVEKYNFEIIYYFHHINYDDDPLYLWRDGKLLAPSNFETRLPAALKAIMQRAGRKPDIVSIGGGTFSTFDLTEGWWDLASTTRVEIRDEIPSKEGIDPPILEYWLQRATKYVDTIEQLIPNTFMMYRFLHFGVTSWGTWVLLDVNSNYWKLDQTPRAPFHEVRVSEMNNLHQVLLERRPQVYKFSWGQLLSGHKDVYAPGDFLHPGPSAARIWSNMFLYYLSLLKQDGSQHVS